MLLNVIVQLYLSLIFLTSCLGSVLDNYKSTSALDLAKLNLSTRAKLKSEEYRAIAETLHRHRLPLSRSAISNDPVLIDLCQNNKDWNFPQPYNCNEFCMCSGGTPYVEKCSSDCSYLPFADLCAYTANSECPTWPSVWQGDLPITCSYYGQRPWWSPSELPADPSTNCGSGFMVCNNFTTIGWDVCPPESGYSKAYQGCLSLSLCELADKAFGFWV